MGAAILDGAAIAAAVGIFFGSWVWILVLTCQALAFSAWVRLKHLGAAVIFVAFFGSAALCRRFGVTLPQ